MREATGVHQPAETRVPYVVECELVDVEGDRRRVLVRNLSRHGAFLLVDGAPEGELELRFPLPDDGPAVRIRAEARWSKATAEERPGELPPGCGFRFLELAESDQQRIDRLVAEHERRPTPLAGVSQPKSGVARVPLVASLRLAHERGETSGRSCNLSLLGVYASVEPVPRVGDTVDVHLTLPGASEPFARRAVVAWRNPETPPRPHLLPAGCGLRFEGLSPADMRKLLRVVDAYLDRLPSEN